MCTQGERTPAALSRRGMLLGGGALLALGLVPALGAAHPAAAADDPQSEPQTQQTDPLAGPPGVFARPLAAKYPVSAAYGIPGNWLAGRHTGIDLAVPSGTPVASVGPGEVEVARAYGDYGNAVLVAMEDGHFVLFAHLSRIAVKEGAAVQGGTRLGDTGATGRVTGPHLHLEVRKKRGYGSDVDPVAYLAERGVSLP
ncbi:M23 family metallopeptidase [Streptomyces sp. 549]|uniref:M23 family metallopeptidase n=1 Tax=Streptomyces sp. 549 TaxID=3049076 RepID=UPI0024C41E2C|nr:M23 family metallopeptidase [Streptomyces sp. 549]MDK1473705.1 M23 family metallopeptidase [Streptomyces sp. 549]